jgi:hypothetical protein
MSKIELLNKKIIDNLKHVSPVGGELSNYVNGGARPPKHMLVDWKDVKQMQEDA